jgi:protein-S-isoprenylcysteine O-methyltransferase Ste14
MGKNTEKRVKDGRDMRHQANWSGLGCTVQDVKSPWKLVGVTSWLLVTAALTCAAIASRSVGKSTWWLGPESNPTFALLWALPFLMPVVSIVAILRLPRIAGYVGIGCSLVLAGVAIGDIAGSPGIAIIEGITAVSALFIAIATLAGRERN